MGALFSDMWAAIGRDRSPLLADLGPSDRNWWRFFLAILVGVFAGFLAVIALMVVGMVAVVVAGVSPAVIGNYVNELVSGEAEQTFWSATGVIWAVAILNGVMMLLGVWLGSLLVKKPLRLSFTTARRWRWRQVFGGFVLYGAALALLLAFGIGLDGEVPQFPAFTLAPSTPFAFVYMALAFGGLLLAAGGEELVFRGWLLRQTANLLPWTWVYLLLNGVIFSLIHGEWDPNALIARAAMGIGFCYMALRFGGIEFSTGAHTANNFLIVSFITPLSLNTPPPGAFSFGMLGETALMLVLMIAVTEIALRVRPIADFLGGPAQNVAAEAKAFD